MTEVVNIRRVRSAFDVYIGRACPRAADPRCHTCSDFANMHRHGRNGVRTAEQAVAMYERWLRRRVVEHAETRTKILALDGLRLGCWCDPDPCHGHAIVRVLEDIKAGAL